MVPAIRLAADRGIAAGENIVCRGAEALAGDEVLATGAVMDAAAIALAASCGAGTLEVFAPPTASIVATGDAGTDFCHLH